MGGNEGTPRLFRITTMLSAIAANEYRPSGLACKPYGPAGSLAHVAWELTVGAEPRICQQRGAASGCTAWLPLRCLGTRAPCPRAYKITPTPPAASTTAAAAAASVARQRCPGVLDTPANSAVTTAGTRPPWGRS